VVLSLTLAWKAAKIKRFNSPYIKYRYTAVQSPVVTGFSKHPDGADDGLRQFSTGCISKKTGGSVKLRPVFSGDLKVHFSGHGKQAVRQKRPGLN